MQEIIVLKSTKKGLVVDTVYKNKDTLKIDVTTATTVQLPKEQLTVNTISPPKEGIELFGLWAAIIGGIAAFIAVGLALWDLFKKDKAKQEQIEKFAGLVGALEAQNDLIKQGNDIMRDYTVELFKIVSDAPARVDNTKLTELEEKRFRLSVKPRIWTNGGGYSGHDGSINISIDNRGELCFIDDFEIVDGDKVNLIKWGSPVPIEKAGNIRIKGTMHKTNPKDASFKIKLYYHDQENFKYESIIEWSAGVTKVIDTKEL